MFNVRKQSVEVQAGMLLQASGRTNGLRTLLHAEWDRRADFLRLANALSALYPKESEEAAAGRMKIDSMTITDRIEIDPKVMMGKPVIKGTRIPIELILRKLSEGATKDDLLDAYPRLTAEDIHAAIGYAADTLAHEETIIVTPKTRALDASRARRYSSRQP
jgi:uncharacterized protein (DUF433 family)